MRNMKMKWIHVFLLGCGLTQASWASIYSASNTPNGQAFVSACAGWSQFGGLENPGSSAELNPGASYVNCNQAQGAGLQSVSVNNSGGAPANHNVTYGNSTSIAAAVGGIGFSATNTGAPLDIFAGASGSGGWNDGFIWNGPSGVWLPQVLVSANLSAAGASAGEGEAVLEVSALGKNGNYLQGAAYSDFLAANAQTKFGDTLVGVDFEVAIWTADYKDTNVIANDVITFAIPVTQGQEVDLGFYASYLVSSGDSADTSESTEIVDPQFSYAGPGMLITNGGTVPVAGSDFGASTGSSFNYDRTYIPEPGGWALTAIGLGAGMIGRIRRSKQ